MRRLVLITAFFVCAAQAASAGTLERVKETGVFRIGYRADARPYSYQDKHGRPAGFIVDLCREVATEFGPWVKTKYVLVHAGERFKSVQDGQIDILCDPSTVTLSRREMVDFSLPTFLDGAGVLSRQSHPVQRFEDLAGKRVGVLTGTTTERLLRDSLKKLGLTAEVVAVRDHRNGMELVQDAKLDAYMADRNILAVHAARRWPSRL